MPRKARVPIVTSCNHPDGLDHDETIEDKGDGRLIVHFRGYHCPRCSQRWQIKGSGDQWGDAAFMFLREIPANPRACPAPAVAGNTPAKSPPQTKTAEEYFAERDAKGGGPGTEGLRMFHAMNFGWCTECNRLANKMDEWGPAGCREPANWNYILVDAYPRALERWQQTKKETGDPDLQRWYQAWRNSPLTKLETARVAAALPAGDEATVKVLIELLFQHAITAAEQKYEQALATEALAAPPESADPAAA
jgi:hypothetical protein